MTLHTVAKHLQEHGRGPDDQLVHMSTKELAGLQALAQQHGGSLTQNPHTGLPEAGFLDSILPTVLGAAATFAFPEITPTMAGLGVGALKGLTSGNLGQGLMAGLGAYGGAGLTQGLTADQLGFTSGSVTGGAGASAADATTGLQAPQYGDISRAQKLNPDLWNNPAPSGADLQGYNPNASFSSSTSPTGSQLSAADTIANNFKNNKMLGLAALSPALTQTRSLNTNGIPQLDQSMVAPRYRYTPGMANPTPGANPQGQENRYFPGQGYTQLSAADAKSLYGFADGGMTYGAGIQDPNMQTVPSYDPVVRMASGGQSYDPKTQTYTTDPTAPANSISSTVAPSMYDPNGIQGGNSSPTTGAPNNGSPTGSAIGDIGYSLSALAPFSVIGMVAQSMMDSMSPTSVTSANATNGSDSQSDAATAAGVAPAGSVNAGVAVGPAASDAPPAPATASGDGDSSDARGGFYTHGKFDQRPSMATGGISDVHYNLGGYSDGGRLLRGPGDGVSDSIPATIGQKQPARLADGEFVVPARIVSELGNGSTEAGARKLYAMMDRVQKARNKTVGKNKVATDTRAAALLPA